GVDLSHRREVSPRRQEQPRAPGLFFVLGSGVGLTRLHPGTWRQYRLCSKDFVEPHRLDAEIRPSNRSDFTGQAVTIAHLDAASLPEDSFLTRLCPQNRAVVMACSVEADWSDVIR